MDHSYPVDREWNAEAFGARSAGVAREQLAAEPSLCAQLEPLLGEDCAPDPAFFVESWTVGAAAATENLHRRLEKHQTSEPPTAFFTSHAFRPFFSSADWLQSATIPLPTQPTADLADLRDAIHNDLLNQEHLLAIPVSLASARRVLGVAAGSSRDQVRIAYRQLANRYHPDRHADQGEEERRLATECMAAINEAYRLLCPGPSA